MTVLLLAVLSLAVGFTGLTNVRLNEGESVPSNTEVLELEVMISERQCRQRDSRLANRLPSGLVSAILATHTSEPSVYFSATTHTEHAFRNGGIGTALRC